MLRGSASLRYWQLMVGMSRNFARLGDLQLYLLGHHTRQDNSNV